MASEYLTNEELDELADNYRDGLAEDEVQFLIAAAQNRIELESELAATKAELADVRADYVRRHHDALTALRERDEARAKVEHKAERAKFWKDNIAVERTKTAELVAAAKNRIRRGHSEVCKHRRGECDCGHVWLINAVHDATGELPPYSSGATRAAMPICTCYDDGVMCVYEPTCPRHRDTEPKESGE